MITVHRILEETLYSGLELRPHYILAKWKIEDSVLVAYRGPCEVKTDHMVDWEDRLANDFIRAKEMIHFMGEFFGPTLKEGIWIQRLLVSGVESELLRMGISVNRDGDDLFINGKKLCVSIVTASPVSILLHLGINVDSEGAPVHAIGLKHYLSEEKIESLIQTTLNRFEVEFKSVHRASVKVRAVI
jgi:hypothetical protein